MSRRVTKHVRELKRKLRPLGYRYQGVTGGNHLEFIHPQAGPLIIPKSASDWRSTKNALAQAKRLIRREG